MRQWSSHHAQSWEQGRFDKEADEHWASSINQITQAVDEGRTSPMKRAEIIFKLVERWDWYSKMYAESMRRLKQVWYGFYRCTQ
jgi:hypothetical protein